LETGSVANATTAFPVAEELVDTFVRKEVGIVLAEPPDRLSQAECIILLAPTFLDVKLADALGKVAHDVATRAGTDVTAEASEVAWLEIDVIDTHSGILIYLVNTNDLGIHIYGQGIARDFIFKPGPGLQKVDVVRSLLQVDASALFHGAMRVGDRRLRWPNFLVLVARVDR
jgi:hypothetical protein